MNTGKFYKRYAELAKNFLRSLPGKLTPNQFSKR